MKKNLILKDLDDTRKLAKALARAARPARALLLAGDLGAGKTTLTRYLCQELSIDPRQVSSPTFSVVHEYLNGTIPVAHADLYRLGKGADIYELGLDEYVERGFFLIIEWAEFMEERLDCPFIQLEFHLLPDGKRQVKIETSKDFQIKDLDTEQIKQENRNESPSS